VPPRNTNVDINVENLADIGFVPRLELTGGEVAKWRDRKWTHAIDLDQAPKASESQNR